MIFWRRFNFYSPKENRTLFASPELASGSHFFKFVTVPPRTQGKRYVMDVGIVSLDVSILNESMTHHWIRCLQYRYPEINEFLYDYASSS